MAGHVEAFRLTKPGASFISSAANLRVTGEQSGINIYNGSATGASATGVSYFPRAQAQTVSGLGLLAVSTADASGIWPVKIPVANERIRVEISSAGAASGVFTTGNYLDLYISGF